MSLTEIDITDKTDLLKTGDIILCHGYNPHGLDPGIDGIIEFFTHSPWEHTGIIIRDPWWTSLKGVYIYQSGSGLNNYPDVLNGKMGKGVTLNRFSDFIENRQHIYVRSLTGVDFSNELTRLDFESAFNHSHGKPYDSSLCNWITAGCDSFFRCNCCKIVDTRHTKSFWCSALVGYMYTKTGIFPGYTDWSIMTPADLVLKNVCYPYSLGNLWCLKK